MENRFRTVLAVVMLLSPMFSAVAAAAAPDAPPAIPAVGDHADPAPATAATALLPADPVAVGGPVPAASALATAAQGALDPQALISSSFEENAGQVGDGRLDFVGAVTDGVVGFGAGRAYLQLVPGDDGQGLLLEFTTPGGRAVAPEGRGLMAHHSNYFTGSDPDAWVVGVRNFGEVAYPAVWEGVEVAYLPKAQGLKYEVRLAPGADLAAVAFAVGGADALALAPGGDLEIHAGARVLLDAAPVAWLSGGAPVECRFSLRSGPAYGFECPAWDGSQALTIDPTVYSTYIGGANGERPGGIVVDASGAAYVSGGTRCHYSASTRFPTTAGAYQAQPATSCSGWDAFVLKLNASGGALDYSTWLIGTSTGGDEAYGIDVDGQGRAVVTGYTWGPDFPTTPGAYDTTYGTAYGTRAFVTMLNASGDGLLYSTYLGGTGSCTGHGADDGHRVALDPLGQAVVTGQTCSQDFPITPGAYHTSYSCSGNCYLPEAYLTKLNATGTGLVYSTFLTGMQNGGESWALDVNDVGEATVGGLTWQTGFTTTSGAYDRSLNGCSDGYVMRVNAAGTGINFSSFFGGSGCDDVRGLRVADNGSIWVTGQTTSSDLPTTPGAYQTSLSGGADAFVAELTPTASGLLASTYLGGSSFEWVYGLALTPMGSVVVAGITNSSDFPVTPGALVQNRSGPSDGFVATFGVDLQGLRYGTLMGGDGSDELGPVAAGDDGSVYFLAVTTSTDFPVTAGAFSGTCYCVGGNGTGYSGWDLAVFKLEPAGPPANLSATAGPQAVSLSWSPPPQVGSTPTSAYRLYRGDDANSTTQLVAQVGPGQTQHNDTGLTDGHTYYYRLSRVDALGERLLPTVVSATPASPPSAPLNLTAQVGPGYVRLTWDAPASNGSVDITRYGLLRGPDGASLVPLANLTAPGSYNDTAVVNGVTYYYAVVAENAVGLGPASAVVSAVPWAPPTAPQGLTATGGDREIRVAWDAPADLGGGSLTQIRLFRGPDAGNLTLLASLSGASRNYTDTNVTVGQTYAYSVQAMTTFAPGPLAPAVTAFARSLPTEPLNLTATGGEGVVHLAWEVPLSDGAEPLVGYVLRRTSDQAGDPEVVTPLGLGTAFDDANVTNGVTYSYSIAAENGLGEGPASAPLATARPAGPPGVPGDFAAEGGDLSVQVHWTAPADDGGWPVEIYRVYRGPVGGPLTAVTEVTAPAGTTYTDTNVVLGEQYDYAVAAANQLGEGPRSAVATAGPVNRDPAIAAAGPFQVTPGKTKTVTLSATDPDGSTALEFSLEAGPAWATLTAGGELTLAPPLGVHGDFSLTVRVQDPNGGEASVDVSVTATNAAPLVKTALCAAPLDGYVGTSFTLGLQSNVTDPDDEPAALEWTVTSPDGAVVTWSVNDVAGTLGVTLAKVGNTTMEVTVTDPVGESASCTVNVHVFETPGGGDGTGGTGDNGTGDNGTGDGGSEGGGFLPGPGAAQALVALAVAAAVAAVAAARSRRRFR